MVDIKSFLFSLVTLLTVIRCTHSQRQTEITFCRPEWVDGDGRWTMPHKTPYILLLGLHTHTHMYVYTSPSFLIKILKKPNNTYKNKIRNVFGLFTIKNFTNYRCILGFGVTTCKGREDVIISKQIERETYPENGSGLKH